MFPGWNGLLGFPGFGYGMYYFPFDDYGYYGICPYPGYLNDGTETVAPSPFASQTSSGRKYLGIDELAVEDARGPGMQVVRVYPGLPAEQAGLEVGDVIHAANGYLTQKHGHLAWIIAHAMPDGVLRMDVRVARNGTDQTVTAWIP